MRAAWLRVHPLELALPAVGALLTIVVAYVTVNSGATIGLGAVGVLLLFVLAVMAFLWVPHLALAATIGLFVFLPTLKVFISPSIGGIKDLIGLAAIIAAALLIIFRNHRVDRRIGVLAAIFMLLYVVDVGHAHGIGWAQGVRLTGEPTLLLVAGMVLRNPQRSLRWALGALIAVGVIISLYGLLQQALGPARLVSLGYSYSSQVRLIAGYLRSFGTLDDPFAFAALLYFSLAAVVFWLRRGPAAWTLGGVMVLGLASSLVRTAAPVLIAFIALALIRRRRALPALCFAAATMVIATGTLLGASGTETQAYTVYFANGGTTVVQSPVAKQGALALNGRVSAWQAAVGSNPFDWAFGRGVGQVGTAAQRASQGLIPGSTTAGTGSGNGANIHATAVDSGYFATVADVGLVGLVVELALLWRLISLGARAARRNLMAGWIALALVAAMTIDALTRASFNAFPTAFVGMLVTGVALAAAADAERSGEAPALDSRRPAGDPGGRRLPVITT